MHAEDSGRYGAIIAAARATYQQAHQRPEAVERGRARMMGMLRARRRRRWARRFLVGFLIVVAVAGAAHAQEPEPTPTLAPVISDTTSATQTLQLQELLRELVYGDRPATTISGTVTTTLLSGTITTTAESDAMWLSTVITETTSSGSRWILQRSFTYGEAAVVIMLMAALLISVLSVMVRVGMER